MLQKPVLAARFLTSDFIPGRPLAAAGAERIEFGLQVSMAAGSWLN